jgi:hypothetical protein
VAVKSLSVVNLAQAYNAKNWEYTTWEPGYAGAAGGSVYGVTILRFDVPAFVGVAEAMEIALISNLGMGASVMLRWALCTSDGNRELYTKTTAAVADSNQLESGIITIPDVTSVTAARSFRIPAAKIKGGSTYYLFLWAYNDTGISIRAVSSGWGDHSAAVLYNQGIIRVKLNGAQKPCMVVVKTGGKVRQTIPYVKTATGVKPGG